MTSPSGKDTIREYFQKHQLSQNQLDLLHAMQSDSDKKRRFTKPMMWMAAAALFVILMATLWLRPSGTQPYDGILLEIETHLAKIKPPDVASDDYLQVQTGLPNLAFQVTQPNHQVLQDWRLAGGRYCSLNGIPAAQLQLTQNGAACAGLLYQAPYSSVWKAKTALPDQITHHGIQYSFWLEGDLLMVFAYDHDRCESKI